MNPLRLSLLVLPLVAAFAATGSLAADVSKVVPVASAAEFRSALRTATAGTRIELAPGDYAGGFHAAGLRGERDRPIVVAAADAKRPPRFVGGANGIHLSDPVFVELHNLTFTGATNNGLNIDDGGKYSSAPRGLVLRGLRIADVGPKGNCDGIKLSGLDGFRVENCVIDRWGIGSGSAIDMVGCHAGVIEGNTFRHVEDQTSTGGNAVQTKGGSRDIVIRKNRFEHAGTRAVNAGGSTGKPFFRPPLDRWPSGEAPYEAKDIVIEGNTFIGSGAPLAFVGVDGATARFNTIYRPGRWAMRILQETRLPEFAPCRNVVVSDNIIVFHSQSWAEGGVNIGGGAAPETFRLARNHWFCLDRPDRSTPKLPTAETDGVHGTDPQFVDREKLDLRLKETSPAKGKGADAAIPPSSRGQ